MLDELRHFLLIASAGTFTEAARRAHLSQPALTAAIHRLEGQLGARLFVRGPAGAELTAEGRALVPHAKAALAAVEDGRRAVAEVAGLERGEVRLGAGATACTYLLPPVLARFRATYPGIRFLLRETTTDAAIGALHAGELDLAVVMADEGEAWLTDELVLVGAPGGPLDPAVGPFVALATGTTTRRLFDERFPSAAIVMELGSIGAIKKNVRQGIGLALVSRSAIVRELDAGELVLVPHPATPIARPLRVVHRGLDRLPPAAARLRELLLAKA